MNESFGIIREESLVKDKEGQDLIKYNLRASAVFGNFHGEIRAKLFVTHGSKFSDFAFDSFGQINMQGAIKFVGSGIKKPTVR